MRPSFLTARVALSPSRQFREGVRTKMGFEGTDEDFALVFKWLDHDGNGTIPFRELDKKLRERPVDMDELRPAKATPAEQLADVEPQREDLVLGPAPGLPAAELRWQHSYSLRETLRGLCACGPMVGRTCIVSPAPLYLRSTAELVSSRLGTLPCGSKVVVLAESQPTQTLTRVRVAHETSPDVPLGWVTLCREGSKFLRVVSASKTPRGFYTSANAGDDGFSALTFDNTDARSRYNSVAKAISLLQERSAELARYEEHLRSTGKVAVPLDRDVMAQWSFQSGLSLGHS